MKVRLDRTVCDGFGICAKHAPGYFSLDDWGYASLIGDGTVANQDRDAVMNALIYCPVHAIRADDDAEQESDVGTRPLAAARLGVSPPACGGEERRMNLELDEPRPDDALPTSSSDEDPTAHLKTEANEAEWGFTR